MLNASIKLWVVDVTGNGWVLTVVEVSGFCSRGKGRARSGALHAKICAKIPNWTGASHHPNANGRHIGSRGIRVGGSFFVSSTVTMASFPLVSKVRTPIRLSEQCHFFHLEPQVLVKWVRI
jgi:hypothetical protein